MTDVNTYLLVILVCAVISVLLRLLPMKINPDGAPAFIHVLINRTGKYVSTTLLACVWASFIFKPDMNPLHNFSWPVLILIALAFFAGRSKLKNHHVFFFMALLYFVMVKLAIT